jgi:hypothetical protein
MIYRFKIGPAVIRIEADSVPHDAEDEGSFYWSFLQSLETSPSLRLRLRSAASQDDVPAKKEAPLLGELSDHWRLYDEGAVFRLEVIDPVGLQPKQIAFFSRDWAIAEVFKIPLAYAAPPRLRSGWVVCDLMEPLIQWWMSTWLAASGKGFVVHASSIGLEGHGMIFIGESGAGKSTISRLAQEKGGIVLNDERSVLWNDSGKWFVSGTPWHGEFAQASAGHFPLHSLFLLRKADRESIRAVPTTRGIAAIVPQIFMSLWSAPLTDSTLALLHRALQETRWGELYFRKDAVAIDFLRNELRPRVPA